MQEAGVLARAVKEQERRKGEKEGFSAAPGDCLAYKHYRDVRLAPALLPLLDLRTWAMARELLLSGCWSKG